MDYVYIGIISAALALAFHRWIIRALQALLLIGFAALLVRGLYLADTLTLQGIAPPALIAGASAVFGLIIGLTVAYGFIRHAIIHFYLKQAIEKQKQAATAGRLW
jgi:hypothetical protein